MFVGGERGRIPVLQRGAGRSAEVGTSCCWRQLGTVSGRCCDGNSAPGNSFLTDRGVSTCRLLMTTTRALWGGLRTGVSTLRSLGGNSRLA